MKEKTQEDILEDMDSKLENIETDAQGIIDRVTVIWALLEKLRRIIE